MLISSMKPKRGRMKLSLSRHLYPLTITLACFCEFKAAGTVTITPSDSAAVCSGTDQFELMCTTTGTVLRWSSSLFGDSNAISHDAPFNQTHNVQVNSTIFTFWRNSSQNIVPLVSRLLISPVSNGLNGSVVNCEDLRTSNMASTTLNIIMDKDVDSQRASTTISLVSQQYEGSGVTVILEWTQADPLYSYHIYITPQLALMFNESTRVQLTVLYNILYNFSVVAVHRCGQHNVTSFTELYYTACRNPAVLIADVSVSVVGFRNPARLGSSISLSCRPGFVLIGPNRTTCMGNGKWEPNIGKVKCQEVTVCDLPSPPLNGYIIPYTSVVEEATVTYVFQYSQNIGQHSVCTEVNITAVCNNNGYWEPNSDGRKCPKINISENTVVNDLSQCTKIAVICSVTSSVMTSVLLFIVGVLCGHFYQRQKHLAEADSSPSSCPIPIMYDDIQVTKQQEEELNMTTNVAYGPVKNL